VHHLLIYLIRVIKFTNPYSSSSSKGISWRQGLRKSVKDSEVSIISSKPTQLYHFTLLEYVCQQPCIPALRHQTIDVKWQLEWWRGLKIWTRWVTPVYSVLVLGMVETINESNSSEFRFSAKPRIIDTAFWLQLLKILKSGSPKFGRSRQFTIRWTCSI